MLIFFENHKYNSDQIKPYLTPSLLYNDIPNHKSHTDQIGYIFITNENYSGPVFILPKSFLISIDGKDTVLGMKGIYPEDVINCDNEENPLEIAGKGSFLPELGLWLYRASTASATNTKAPQSAEWQNSTPNSQKTEPETKTSSAQQST